MESLNTINIAEEAKRNRPVSTAAGSENNSGPETRVPSDDKLAAKALLIASQISAASLLRPLMNFSSTTEFMNSMYDLSSASTAH
jgi:hypothetical protein